MGNTAHSKKPWSVDILDEENVWIMDEDGNYIAEIVSRDEEGRFVDDPDERMANAELMADAPVLLERLSELIAACEEGDPENIAASVEFSRRATRCHIRNFDG